MRNWIMLMSLLVLASTRVDAAVLRGCVLRNEEGGAPISGVEISAETGASPTATLTNGSFKLEFPKKQPGEMVKLIVSKPEHVVINHVQLRRPLPKDADAESLTILLCKTELREEMARRFYRLKSIEAIEEQYKKEIRELEASKKATEAALAKLMEKREQAKAMAESTAEQLAKQEPEITSDLRQTAMRLFLDGKVGEALKILNDEAIHSKLEAAKREASQCYLLKARLHATRFEFGEAIDAYHSACGAALPDAFEPLFAYAEFCRHQNRDEIAERGYKACVRDAKERKDQVREAVALNGLGMLFQKQGRLDLALVALLSAGEIRERLYEQDQATHALELAVTLNNVSTVFRDKNDLDKARLTCQTGVEILLPLMREENSQIYTETMVRLLINLGKFNENVKMFDKAAKAYFMAKQFISDLPEQSEQALFYEASVLIGIGDLHSSQGQWEDARLPYFLGLDIYNDLALKNPYAYTPYTASAVVKTGDWLHNQNRREEAIKTYQLALRMFRDASKYTPETYSVHVAQTLEKLSQLCREENRSGEARQMAEEALSIYKKLTHQHPERDNSDVERVERFLRGLPGAM